MGSEPLLSGIMLAVANIAPLRDLGSYGLLALAIYLIGFLVTIPVLAFDELEEEEISDSIQKTGANIFRAISQGYVFILLASLFWPLLFVFLFPYLCFTRQTNYLVMPFTFITISLSILAIDALTKPATPVLLGAIEENSWQRSRTARDILQHRADPTAILPLIKLVQNSPVSHVRQNALKALSGVENEGVLSLLFHEFTLHKGKLKSTALNGLGNYEPSFLIAKLIPLLESRTPNVARDSVDLLERKIKQLGESGSTNPENAANLLDAQIRKYMSLWVASEERLKPPKSADDSLKRFTDAINRNGSVKLSDATAGFIAQLKKKAKLRQAKYRRTKLTRAARNTRRRIVSILTKSTRIMGILEAPVVTPLFIEMIDDRTLPGEVQSNIVKGLGRKGASEEVFQALADALGQISHYDAKRSIISSLGIIGNKSAIPLLVAQLTDWRSIIQKETIKALSKFNWKASSTTEIIHLAAAKRDKKLLLERWQDTKEILLADVASKDGFARNNAVYTFIRLGRETILPDLVKIIHKQGHIGLARTYLHSGNKTLKSAGIKWAHTHGYVIKTVKRSQAVGGYAGWGKK